MILLLFLNYYYYQIFWLGANPDGVIFDIKIQKNDLLEIQYTYSKKLLQLNLYPHNLSIESTFTSKSFYVALKKIYIQHF